MAIPVVMPKLGMVMSEGTLTRWTRAKGDAVRAGEVIAEIETEKISYELEATADGIVHPLVAEGATLPVDGLMGWLLDGRRSGARARNRSFEAGARRSARRGGHAREPREPDPTRLAPVRKAGGDPSCPRHRARGGLRRVSG